LFLQLFPKDLKCALYCGLRQSKPRVQTCSSPSQDLHLAVVPRLEVAPHLEVVLLRLHMGPLHFLAPEYPPKAWEEGDYAIHNWTLAHWWRVAQTYHHCVYWAPAVKL